MFTSVGILHPINASYSSCLVCFTALQEPFDSEIPQYSTHLIVKNLCLIWLFCCLD
jgi:hypothetical protein